MTTEKNKRTERRRAMAPLSDDDVDRIAAKVKEEMTSEFDLDPKTHYDMHNELEKMAGSFNGVKGIFTRVFVSAVVMGGIVLAGWSMFGKKM